MSDFRSKRSRKQVDYSQFSNSGNDLDDDDDFADVTPPPGKKPKKSVPPKPKSTNQEKKQKDVRKSKERIPVSERNFERELQLAMEISMNESSGTAESDPPVLSKADTSDAGVAGESLTVTVDIENEVTAPPPNLGDPVTMVAGALPNVVSKSELCPQIVDDEDEIEVLAKDIIIKDGRSEALREKRKAANKAATHWMESDDENESFAPVKTRATRKSTVDDSAYKDSDLDSMDSPSDSEDWDPSDDDSDFEGQNKKNSKRKVKTNTKSNKKKTEPKPKTNAAPVNHGKSNKSATAVKKQTAAPQKTAKENVIQYPASKPSTGTTPSHENGSKKHLGAALPRKPASTGVSSSPRVCLTAGTTVRSPSGGLRIGLSKKARIKPLHPSVNNIH